MSSQTPDRIIHTVPYKSGDPAPSPTDPRQLLLERLESYDAGLASIANFYRESPDRLLKYNYRALLRRKDDYVAQRVNAIQFLAGDNPQTAWVVEMQLKQPRGTNRCTVKLALFAEIDRSEAAETDRRSYRNWWVSQSGSITPERASEAWVPDLGYNAHAFASIKADKFGRIFEIFSIQRDPVTYSIETTGMKFDRNWLAAVDKTSEGTDTPSRDVLETILGKLPLQELSLR